MKPRLHEIRITLGTVLICLIMACSERDRDNPLDPHNVDTGGRPTGLRAVSMERSVHLEWTPLNLRDLTGIDIYRCAGDGEFTRFDSTAAGTYIDQKVEYGIRYQYYITARSAAYESPPSEVVATTPGPTFTWVADYGSGYVSCLSHDLNSLVGSFGQLFYPQVVACSPQERAAWASARYESQLYKVGQTGRLFATVPNMTSITDLAVDTTSGDVWVARKEPGVITRLDRYGVARATSSMVQKPMALAATFTSGACWVVDAGDRHLKCFNSAAQRIVNSQDPLLAPQDLVLCQDRGKIWVADSTAIVQFDFSGVPTGLRCGPFFYLNRLVHDNRRHCLWAIDVEQIGVPSKLIKLDENGLVQLINTTFSYPIGLAVNDFDGSCLVGDAGYDHFGLFRVSGDGSRVDLIDSFISPVSIDIEYH